MAKLDITLTTDFASSRMEKVGKAMNEERPLSYKGKYYKIVDAHFEETKKKDRDHVVFTLRPIAYDPQEEQNHVMV